MKGFFVYIVLLFILNFYCGISYSAQDDKTRTQSQPLPVQYQQPSQEMQVTKPILPPVVPSASLGVSPTLSPHIAAPPITPRPMSTPSAETQIPKIVIQDLPSVPAHVAVPITDISTELPQVPIISNSLGIVIDIGSEEDGSSWIEMKDEILDETLKIKIDPKNTPVIKGTTVLSFKDIRIGDTVNVIFNQEGEGITANFISIMTEEDLKAMEEALPSKE